MALLGIDLGGTKLATALFSGQGQLLSEEVVLLEGRKGTAVGALMGEQLTRYIRMQKETGSPVTAIGLSVPGIYHRQEGTVWAPNIPGWEAYPLRKELAVIAEGLPLAIDSDRACYILGEAWQGAAKACTDAVYLGVGTGIGAGILAEGRVLRGAYDTAGAVGWMAIDKPYKEKYKTCGCLEWGASGEGMARLTRELLSVHESWASSLRVLPVESITAHQVFAAYEEGDELAGAVLQQCIESWGMMVANLVSLLNPQKIILGGGVFGPAVRFLPAIAAEARKWAQPLSMESVSIEASALGTRAGLYGAAFLAAQLLPSSKPSSHG